MMLEVRKRCVMCSIDGGMSPGPPTNNRQNVNQLGLSIIYIRAQISGVRDRLFRTLVGRMLHFED
jgi:hypothetical protein